MELEQSGVSKEQEMELDPELKAALLLDIMEISVASLLDQGKDIPLSDLKEIKMQFLPDGSVKFVLVQQSEEEGSEPSEEVVDVSAEEILSVIEEELMASEPMAE